MSAPTMDLLRMRTLGNGLQVLVLPDSSVPAFAWFTTWRVGSRNERPGITGISHLFEHLMFNGAKKYGPKMFDRVIESNGGSSNAYTSHDVTAYHEAMPSEKLAVVLDLELDRMRDLDLTERNLASEREVVKEERRLRTDESPIGALYEHLYAAAYMAHPYRWPVIGWMADIDAITTRDIEAYFRVHYSPRNAVVTIAGDLDPERALDDAEAALSVLVNGEPPPPVVRSEPEQHGERRVVLRKEAQLPTFLAAWHACDATSPDLAAHDVLQEILDAGDSARMRRALVLDGDLAVDVNVDFPWTIDPGLFTIAVTLRPGVEPARAEAAMQDVLESVASEPPSERELAKAKSQLLADHWRRFKTAEGRADMLGNAVVLQGGAHELFDLPERWRAVTAEDVQRVAQSMTVDRRTVALLEPVAGGAGEDE
jgi:zinc protease